MVFLHVGFGGLPAELIVHIVYVLEFCRDLGAQAIYAPSFGTCEAVPLPFLDVKAGATMSIVMTDQGTSHVPFPIVLGFTPDQPGT